MLVNWCFCELYHRILYYQEEIHCFRIESIDVRLSGLLLGQTLHTKAHEIYRAYIEATTAFGALTIINMIEETNASSDSASKTRDIRSKDKRSVVLTTGGLSVVKYRLDAFTDQQV